MRRFRRGQHHDDPPAARLAAALHPRVAVRAHRESRTGVQRRGVGVGDPSGGSRGMRVGRGQLCRWRHHGRAADHRLTDRDDVFLFLDIGTNGEIVIGNADWMVGCACSAGPAFEGAGSSAACGRPRARSNTWRSAGPAHRALDVSAAENLRGICGSGLICLLGELFERGIIDPAGHFNLDSGKPAPLVSSGGRRAFESGAGHRDHRSRHRKPDSHQGRYLCRLRAGAGECRPGVERDCARLHRGRLRALHAHFRRDPHRHAARSGPARFRYLAIRRSPAPTSRCYRASTGAGGRDRLPHDICRSELRPAIHGRLRSSHVPAAHGPVTVSFRASRFQARTVTDSGGIIHETSSRTSRQAGEILISDGAMGTFLHAKGLAGRRDARSPGACRTRTW